MSKKCCIPNCRLQKDDPGCLKLNFFLIPSNEHTRNEWSRNIKQYFKKEIEIKKYTYVCALHFEPTCFNYSEFCNVVRLKKGSCPTIFENYSSEEQQVQNVVEIHQDIPIDESSNICSNNHLNDNQINVSTNAATVSSASINLQRTCNVSMSTDHIATAHAKLQDTDLQDDSHYDPSDCLADTMEVSQIIEISQSSTDSSKISLEKNIVNKSLANINLDLIDYENKTMMRQILEKAQREIINLRRYRRVQAMRLYRARKKIKNSASLISYVKQCHLISDKVSEILKDCDVHEASQDSVGTCTSK